MVNVLSAPTVTDDSVPVPSRSVHVPVMVMPPLSVAFSGAVSAI